MAKVKKTRNKKMNHGKAKAIIEDWARRQVWVADGSCMSDTQRHFPASVPKHISTAVNKQHLLANFININAFKPQPWQFMIMTYQVHNDKVTVKTVFHNDGILRAVSDLNAYVTEAIAMEIDGCNHNLFIGYSWVAFMSDKVDAEAMEEHFIEYFRERGAFDPDHTVENFQTRMIIERPDRVMELQRAGKWDNRSVAAMLQLTERDVELREAS